MNAYHNSTNDRLITLEKRLTVVEVHLDHLKRELAFKSKLWAKVREQLAVLWYFGSAFAVALLIAEIYKHFYG